MTCIDNNNRIIFYYICKIPLISICHIVTLPPWYNWLTSKQRTLYLIHCYNRVLNITDEVG